MPIRIILGLGATVIAFAIAGRRFAYLFRLIGKGQSDPKRFTQFRARAWAELPYLAQCSTIIAAGSTACGP